MFLLNSRSPLVTATSSSRSWHPLYRRYRANLPSSLTSVGPKRLGLFTQGHLCRISVRTNSTASRRLSRGPGVSRRLALRYPISRLCPLLVITTLHGLISLEQVGFPCSAYPDPNLQEQNTVWYRNINLFPFRHSRIRYALGPTNPRLTIIVEEP